MIQEGQLAYFKKVRKSYKPIGPAHKFRKTWEKVAMLWGDPVYVFEVGPTHAKVSAKGHHLKIQISDLMETPILCIYQIDVGQGDSALVHTPDDRWLMIDGGPAPSDSNSGKGAANFLFWKMFVDQSWKREFNFNDGPFVLDALVCTHPDSDHYGGFDLLTEKVDSGQLIINTVYHNGIGRFKSATGFTKYENGSGFCQLGPVAGTDLPDAYLTVLIDSFDDIRAFLDATPSRDWKLHGEFRDWLEDLQQREGQGLGALQRLHHNTGHLPGYGPDESDVSIRVLGPFEERKNGKPALRYLDTAGKSAMSDPSVTRNGQSVILRCDFGRARILFTGDLNFRSQALLLSNVPAAEFRAHVAKACHHGSEDISVKFLQAVGPWATMISSGDNEGHVHPRALMLGLTGATSLLGEKGSTQAFLGFEEPRYVAPLLYSTELSRSVRLREPQRAMDANEQTVPKAKLQAKKATGAADGLMKELDYWLLADELTYGLINVRTDGERIRMAVLKENQASFQVESFDV
jgi:beta-lactamase superfamily II metal-dependent hydrolase